MARPLLCGQVEEQLREEMTMTKMSQEIFSSRTHLFDGATDPVVVGLGRILVGVGALALTGMLALGWLILSYLGW